MKGDCAATSRRRDARGRRALTTTDMVCALAGLALAATMDQHRLSWVAVLIAPAVVACARALGLYEGDVLLVRRSTLDEVPALAQLSMIFTLAVYLFSDVLVTGGLGRGAVVVCGLAFLGLDTAGRAITRALLRFVSAPERCMLIGSGATRQRLGTSLMVRDGATLVHHFRLRETAGGRRTPLSLQLDAARARLQSALHEQRVDRVIVAVDDRHIDDILDGILWLKSLGVKVSFVPHMPEVLGAAGEFEHFDGLPVLGVRDLGLSSTSSLLKRTLDLLIAGLTLAVLAPLLAIIAGMIRLGSPGPVLFRQPRVGRHGAVFHIHKFRTMHTGAERARAQLASHNETAGLFKLTDDPRVTKVGRWLRRSSLDELPQLIDVLRGDMSLVGPRPLVLDEDRQIRGWARRRLDLTPGMTGPWQVLRATRVPLDEMVKIDYLYVANWSLWGDIKALLRTCPHIVMRRGL